MRFVNFEQSFHEDAATSEALAQTRQVGPGESEFGGFLSRYGGRSFERGLYRVITPNALGSWNVRVSDAFSNFAGRIRCFAYDWLGRVFSLDGARIVAGSPQILMYEPGTGEVLEIPYSLRTFHEEIPDVEEAALAKSFHQNWLAQGGAIPNLDQCIGYKRPLYLGGSDTVENLELSDLDVYWSISCQLLRRVAGFPGS